MRNEEEVDKSHLVADVIGAALADEGQGAAHDSRGIDLTSTLRHS